MKVFAWLKSPRAIAWLFIVLGAAQAAIPAWRIAPEEWIKSAFSLWICWVFWTEAIEGQGAPAGDGAAHDELPLARRILLFLAERARGKTLLALCLAALAMIGMNLKTFRPGQHFETVVIAFLFSLFAAGITMAHGVVNCCILYWLRRAKFERIPALASLAIAGIAVRLLLASGHSAWYQIEFVWLFAKACAAGSAIGCLEAWVRRTGTPAGFTSFFGSLAAFPARIHDLGATPLGRILRGQSWGIALSLLPGPALYPLYAPWGFAKKMDNFLFLAVGCSSICALGFYLWQTAIGLQRLRARNVLAELMLTRLRPADLIAAHLGGGLKPLLRTLFFAGILATFYHFIRLLPEAYWYLYVNTLGLLAFAAIFALIVYPPLAYASLRSRNAPEACWRVIGRALLFEGGLALLTALFWFMAGGPGVFTRYIDFDDFLPVFMLLQILLLPWAYAYSQRLLAEWDRLILEGEQ